MEKKSFQLTEKRSKYRFRCRLSEDLPPSFIGNRIRFFYSIIVVAQTAKFPSRSIVKYFQVAGSTSGDEISLAFEEKVGLDVWPSEPVKDAIPSFISVECKKWKKNPTVPPPQNTANPPHRRNSSKRSRHIRENSQDFKKISATTTGHPKQYKIGHADADCLVAFSLSLPRDVASSFSVTSGKVTASFSWSLELKFLLFCEERKEIDADYDNGYEGTDDGLAMGVPIDYNSTMSRADVDNLREDPKKYYVYSRKEEVLKLSLPIKVTHCDY
ncbi:hypothetical protein AAMO2058_001615400 [Amorphochlora amoebiformis]